MEKINSQKNTFLVLIFLFGTFTPFFSLAANTFSWTPNNCSDYSCTVTQNITTDNSNYWVDIFNVSQNSYATDGKVDSQDGIIDTAQNLSNCVSGGFCSTPGIWKAVVVDSTDPNESIDCEGSGNYNTCKASSAFIEDLGTFFTVSNTPVTFSSIFYTGMTQPVGQILENGLVIVLEVMGSLLALAILMSYVKKWIGHSGSNNKMRFTHKVLEGKDRTTGYDNF